MGSSVKESFKFLGVSNGLFQKSQRFLSETVSTSGGTDTVWEGNEH